MEIRVGRAYDPVTEQDGCRVLVDRLWPRGISKATAELDEWCPAAAPSTGLRKWDGHDPARFPEFRRRYREDLVSGDGAAALQPVDLPHQRARRPAPTHPTIGACCPP